MIRRTLTKWRASAFVRYALSYLSLLAIVLAVAIGYMCCYVDREVRNKTLESQINRLSRIAFQHEEYISAMLNTAEQIGLSPFIEPFSFEEEPWRAYDLLRQLAPYTVTNSFCDQMYLRFAGDSHLYSSSSSMTLDMFANLLQYENVSRDALLSMLDNTKEMQIIPAQRVVSRLVDGSESEMVTFLVPLGMSLKSSKGSLVFLLKEAVYRDMFSDAIELGNNTYIFQDGRVLAADGDFDLPDDAVFSALAGLDGQASPAYVSFDCNGESWYLLALKNRDWGMRYAAVLRVSDLRGTILNGLWGVLLLAVPIAALGVLLALYLAKRSIRPIRAISSLLPNPTGTGDEMKSILDGVQQLTQSNTDLISRLDRSLPMQRHEFVIRFMKGRFSSRAETVAAAAALGLNIDKPCYAVALSSVSDSEEQPFDLRKPPFAADHPDTVGVGVELVAMSVHLYLIFAADAQAVSRMADRIREVSLEQRGHGVVALGGVQTDFSRAPTAYLEAATAYDNRFIMDDSRLINYSDISGNMQDILPQARKITDGINHAIRLNNRALLENKMDELLHFFRHTSMSPFAFRLLYNDVIDTLLREHADTWPKDAEPLAAYDIFSLSGCQSIDDLDALLRKLCDAILRTEDAPAALDGADEPSVISQVVAYMNEHFADSELSISAIAEAFNMSTARLSLAFKEMMRLSPLEYLTVIRVEHSKALLRRTDLSIKEISQRVGYYDASSFIRRFKQMTGETPLQYRRSTEEET